MLFRKPFHWSQYRKIIHINLAHALPSQHRKWYAYDKNTSSFYFRNISIFSRHERSKGYFIIATNSTIRGAMASLASWSVPFRIFVIQNNFGSHSFKSRCKTMKLRYGQDLWAWQLPSPNDISELLPLPLSESTPPPEWISMINITPPNTL